MSTTTEYNFRDEAVVEGELQLFRTLWHTSNDNLFIVRRDLNGEYISEKSNNSLERTFNLTPNQTDGVPLRSIMDETTYEKVAQRYDECINKNKPITYEESHVIDESGERFWNTTILPSFCDETGIVRIFGSSREVTHIRHIEKELQQSNQRLEQEVQERTKELTKALEKMQRLSTTDTLTNLNNRYKIEEILKNEIKRIKRYDGCFGLLILDIDHFKDINDSFGHIQGDKVLQEFARVLRAHTRESDNIGRWGGEEFLVIVPESSEKAILNFANRLRIAIEQHEFDKVGQITVSIGTTLFKMGSTIESLISRADRALYICKNSGRNSVSIAS